jgi:hypothetical protein
MVRRSIIADSSYLRNMVIVTVSPEEPSIAKSDNIKQNILILALSH